jgi:hypothetical protein
MVKVISAILRTNDKGSFISFELMGDIELVQSQNTGRFYATAKRCFISSTFSLETAKGLIGQILPGKIVRIACDPYSYILPESREEITLSHTYRYTPMEERHVDEEIQSPKQMQESL